MVRQTVDFGIDLGTTNSTIAVFNGTGVEVFKNNEEQQFTPSAVWIDGRNKLYVGRLAKEHLEDDNENAKCEFKLQMGENMFYEFARSGRRMKPEELSAEVLKSLRGDVQQHSGEQVIASVISVPAAFEYPQNNATNEAAKLAGFEYTELIMEPVAAAIAHGFGSRSNGVFWMVYDFGGGTFDVAIIKLEDREIKLVKHCGDNELGGKHIDWNIVEKIFVPALIKEYRLPDFNRNNLKWKSAFAKLKYHAENSKIRLSRDKEIGVLIDPLCKDERGNTIRFEYELKRSEIEPLLEPFIVRSINLCKKALAESKLSSGNLEKVILVGGPTLTPCIKEALSSELKIPLDFSKDPLTVNAQGAAIFASTRRLPDHITKKYNAPDTGQYVIDLDYSPSGNDPEPLVGGKVVAKKNEPLTGFTIEISEKKSSWRSGKINLSANGTFTVTLQAQEGMNDYIIELRDSKGNICKSMPDHFTYNLTIYIPPPPVISSVGITLANGEMQIFIEKGTPLPVRKRISLHTTKELKRGATGEFLRIPVVEGEIIRRADRNRLIGALAISGSDIVRDIPEGSEVEITISIDTSRLVKIQAYVNILDKEYEDVLTYDTPPANSQELAEEFKREKERFEKAQREAAAAGIAQANQTLVRIRNEDMVNEIESLLASASTDPDSAKKCNKRLLDFEIAVDEVEETVKWPALVAEAEKEIINARKVVDELGTEEDKVNFKSSERGTRAAIADTGETALLKQKIEELNKLYWGILLRKTETWVDLFKQLKKERSSLRPQELANQLIVQGDNAINSGDFTVLQSVVQQLYGLIPGTKPPWVKKGYEGDMEKHGA